MQGWLGKLELALVLAAGAALSAQTPAAPPAASGDVFVVGGAQAPAAAPAATPAPAPAAVHKLPDPAPERLQQIIQIFTTHEKNFRALLASDYVYTESILMQELDGDGQPVGDYQQINDITYTTDGTKQIVCTFCPQPTLKNIGVTEDDITDMFNMNMYTISVDDLPEYNITYVDHEPLDQITAYVFTIAPKTMEKGHRYFQGKVWVDDHDLMIVKSQGEVVPNQVDKHGNVTNYFPPFTVWREKIDGKYWFPVYTLMQGSVPGTPPTPMKMVLQFKNYRRFRSSARIISVQALPSGTAPTAPPPSAPSTPGNK